MQLAQLSYAWKLDVDETVDISYHFIPHEPHEPPNCGSIGISTDETVRKKCVRQDTKTTKYIVLGRPREREREKIKRNDYNN